MTDRVRGIIISVAFVVALVATVIDGVNDGFSVWNWVTIACAAFLIPYGIALTMGKIVTNRIKR
jgi:hypothetical protein